MISITAIDEARARMVAINADSLATPPPEIGTVVPIRNESQTQALVPERLRTALARRTALESAWATIRARGDADVGDLRAAVANADAGAIVLAVETQAFRAWVDANLGQLDTTAHTLNAAVQQEVVAAIYADASAILASLAEHTSDPTTEYVRRIATDATTMNAFVFDIQGRPTPAKTPILSSLATIPPR